MDFMRFSHFSSGGSRNGISAEIWKPEMKQTEEYKPFHPEAFCRIQEKAAVFTTHPAGTGMNLEWFDSYEKIRGRLFIRVGSYDKNRSVLSHAPYLLMADLAVTCHICLEIGSMRSASFMVTDELLERFGVARSTLFSDAFASSIEILPPDLDTIGNVLAGSGCFIPESSGGKMLVLTNTRRIYGASAMFYPGVLREAERRMKGSILILPSSVHEVIILRETDHSDCQALAETVKMINFSQVAMEDRLSDHVYRYNSEKETIELAD